MIAKAIRVTDRKSIGYRIASLRAKSGQIQGEFGAPYNASKSVVSKWERGDNIPTLDRLRRIAKDYDTTVNWLLYGEGEKDGNV
ncbi:helix-turn-helix domain-containing protein [Staphylococcus gallinarum]|uniref:helix-turn-helix domain-containing protein n=1 Tax=Staphylococcus gallinarum TaxID=1293 RepID=UPI000D1E7BEA|nr:helix-turn-helix domain-containing protein [Staphylococcus gallinarum]PTK92530.1 hypothetical protein BUZ13_07990 [Staphylococcus gallinarum]PTK93441.1 hypothetical protein BUZ05_07280 [Staphylococcus gallinarum]RIO87104.1 helix-turn-helix domain-containing protein [Staphylococcus gallinarum]